MALAEPIPNPGYQMHVRFKDPYRFKSLLDGIKDLTREVTFDFDPEGRVSMQAMDETKIILIILQYEIAAFSKFYCSETISVSLPVEKVVKLFYSIEQGQECDMYYGKRGKNLLSVEKFSKGEVNSSWIPVGNGDDENFDVPDLSTAMHIILPSSDFIKIMRDYVVLEVDDSVEISCTSDTLSFSIGNDDATTGQVQYKKGQMTKQKREVVFGGVIPEDLYFCQKFNLKLMMKVSKVTGGDEDMTCYIQNGIPFCVGTSLGDTTFGHCLFFCANRITQDDEE